MSLGSHICRAAIHSGPDLVITDLQDHMQGAGDVKPSLTGGCMCMSKSVLLYELRFTHTQGCSTLRGHVQSLLTCSFTRKKPMTVKPTGLAVH